MQKTTSKENTVVAKVLANPFYAINIDEMLSAKHETLTSEGQWVKANTKLIGEMGAEKWLYMLLDILKGNYE